MKLILTLFLIASVRCEKTYIDIINYYENITVADTETICTYFQGANVTEKCWEQLEIVCGNTTLLMTMLDASSKFPYSGLGYSTRTDYGNFDQCLSVDHTYSGGRILGEFCKLGLVIPDVFGNISDTNSMFKLSVCRPNACSASDYNAIVQYLLSLSSDVTGLFADGICTTKETYSTFSAADIAALTPFGIIITLMAASTIYDIYLYLNGYESSHPVCLAFSVLSNGRKLLHISKHASSKEHIEVFHGFRVISMMWIVAGHGVSTFEYAAVTNAETVANWPSKFSSFYMNAAHLAVDTFFFMSGFLLAFQYFKGEIRTFKDQVFSVPHVIVHRLLRLTPPLFMIYLLVITFYRHLGSGPIWSYITETLADTCKTHWWRVFLYIQNYFSYEEICLGQTWYLSVDMQMFLISPLFLIPISLIFKKFGFNATMLGLLILNTFWTELPMAVKLIFRNYSNEYDTHSRIIDYFIGITLGLFMRIRIDKPFLYMIKEKNKSVINFITWSTTILGMLVIILCYQDQQTHRGYESRTVFDSLMRPAWCLGLCWITYSCYHGKGGFVNWILSRPIFQVIGRLTYCIYLVHAVVIVYVTSTARTKIYFSDYNIFYQFCGHYVVSIIVATFWTLAFESPLIIIEKYLTGGARSSPQGKSRRNKNVEKGLSVEKT